MRASVLRRTDRQTDRTQVHVLSCALQLKVINGLSIRNRDDFPKKLDNLLMMIQIKIIITLGTDNTNTNQSGMEVFLRWRKLHLRPRRFGQQGNRKCVDYLDLELGFSLEIFKISFSDLKTSKSGSMTLLWDCSWACSDIN